MASHPNPSLTPEQYLEIERHAETKSEYHDGEMFAMSSAREGRPNCTLANPADCGSLSVRPRKKPSNWLESSSNSPSFTMT